MMKYLLIGILFCAKSISAQFTLSYYPWQSMLGLTKNIRNIVAFDYKVETNSFLNQMNMELSARRYKPIMLQEGAQDNLRVFLKVIYHYGIGCAFNPARIGSGVTPLNGYFIDLGMRWYIPQVNHLSIIFECSPYVNEGFTNGNIRTRLGLGYRFGKNWP
ncbi:MAG: hypothetical protein IPN26_16760 [Bacteroidetes bacterium]|nr:hypothetical protein [Bacteroidota bacterium]